MLMLTENKKKNIPRTQNITVHRKEVKQLLSAIPVSKLDNI